MSDLLHPARMLVSVADKVRDVEQRERESAAGVFLVSLTTDEARVLLRLASQAFVSGLTSLPTKLP
jgi:hypothetical protein